MVTAVVQPERLPNQEFPQGWGPVGSLIPTMKGGRVSKLIQARMPDRYVEEIERLAEKHHVKGSDVVRVALVTMIVQKRDDLELRLAEIGQYRDVQEAEA